MNYKNAYEEMKKLYQESQQEKQKLGEENKELRHWKELHSGLILAKQNIELFNQQKDFIKYMEDKIEKELNELDTLCKLNKISRYDSVYKCAYTYIIKMIDILQQFKEIMKIEQRR